MSVVSPLVEFKRPSGVIAMTQREYRLYQSLAVDGVAFTYVCHRPVFTVKENLEILPSSRTGLGTKNLFLCNRKKTIFVLLSVAEHTAVNIKEVSRFLDISGGLSFASPEYLLLQLGVTPGSVTLLSVFDRPNTAEEVVVVIDQALIDAPAIIAHPLRNDASLIMPSQPLLQWIKRMTGNDPTKITINPNDTIVW